MIRDILKSRPESNMMKSQVKKIAKLPWRI